MSIYHVVVKHQVKGNAKEIFHQFDQKLFEALAPVFPSSKLLRYDGNKNGDLVEIALGIWPMRQIWLSKIQDVTKTDSAYSFTDVGQKLPFPIKQWKHIHRVNQINKEVVEIVEDITFKVIGGRLVGWSVEWFFTRMMEARGIKYKRYFMNN